MRRDLRPFLAAALVASCIAAGSEAPAQDPLASALWEAWPSFRVSPADPWALRSATLLEALERLQARHPGLIARVEEGRSAEGRRIPLLRVGKGPTGVLLWSQMHGDEPTATAALLDALNVLGLRREDPAIRRILDRLTLWIIPMLNPDGAERQRRWNAQEIDINRDALRLASPEGRFLKAVRDREKPLLGYNLHNQNPLLRAGGKGPQAALSLLSVPEDASFAETPGVRRTRQLAATVARLLAPFAPGRIARYDTEYTPQAFGDALTRWGTPILLIESGGWAGPGESERLVRLNVVALIGSLAALAEGGADRVDPGDYAAIPPNARDAVSALVLRNLRLAGGRGLPPFQADLAFALPAAFAGERPRRRRPALERLGDLSQVLALSDLDGGGLLAAPWPLADAAQTWPELKADLDAKGLAETDEARLLATLKGLGEAAVARPGFEGALLLYRPAAGRLRLAGAVLGGRVVGEAFRGLK